MRYLLLVCVDPAIQPDEGDADIPDWAAGPLGTATATDAVSLVTIVLMCSFDCLPSFGFRSTRYGANAAGQTTSIIATSIDDECVENARASCEYDASEAAGCGTTFTLMPVSFVNLVANARSRW